MLNKDILRVLLLILLLTACNRDAHPIPSSLSGEPITDCTEEECIQSKDAFEVGNNIAAIPSVLPCSENRENYVQNLPGLSGTLAYMLAQDTKNIHFLGEEFAIERSIEVDDAPFYLIGFSPDGKWLAYRTGIPFEGIPQTINLISNVGEVIQTTPTELISMEASNYSGIWGSMLWVNSHSMLIYITQTDLGNPESTPLVTKALLDPFTGEWLQSYLRELERKSTGSLAFSPDMTHVLFISEAENRFPEIRLWDLTQQELVWSQQDALTTLFSWEENWTGSAAWSPNSNWVAFTINENQMGDNKPSDIGVFLLDKEGVAGKAITDFFSRYGRPVTTGALSWSPNNRYLAMLISIDKSDENDPFALESRVYLYDLQEDELIDFCWVRGNSIETRSTTKALVWSPDSRYLAYVAPPSVSENNKPLPSALILVDIYTGEVIELVENASQLGGWSENFLP